MDKYQIFHIFGKYAIITVESSGKKQKGYSFLKCKKNVTRGQNDFKKTDFYRERRA